ncbi:hypothetical protein ACIHCV_41915 [Streptomyces sp. NPDC051956]|uniref:hypothetical protein n=1 Tax=Streptomyces sp. NPDC051956 TaxID=3365677 RepID=UPI0037D11C73
MGLRFPNVNALGPVSALEWDTLHALNLAYIQAHAQWDATLAASRVLSAQMEMAEGWNLGDAAPYHREAVDDLARLASRHDDQMAAVAWRYASAGLVLGMAVLDRLMQGTPPLSHKEILALGEREPTLAQLEAVLQEPFDRLIQFRDDDLGGLYRSDRDELRTRVETAFLNVQEDQPGISRDQAGRTRLAAASEPNRDPLWEELLPGVLKVAESLPYDISFWLDYHGPDGS